MFGPSFYKLGWIKLVVGYMVESGRPAKGIVEVTLPILNRSTNFNPYP